MSDEGRPSISWMEKNWKLVLGIMVAGSALAFVVKYVNPDTLIKFAVEQEKRTCEVRIHQFIDRGKFCHMNTPVGNRWMCWTIKQ